MATSPRLDVSGLDVMQRLGIAAADVLLAVSVRNLEHGDTFAILIPRRRIKALAAALEAAYPGYLQRCRDIEAQP